MNKSQKIHLTGDNVNSDKYIKLKLEQDIDTLELLTLSLKTEDVYQNYNADYGVLVGRVLANDGIGVPNAKISIFIPITDEDSKNGIIMSVYPYTTPRDKNYEGKRYNLLPRIGSFDDSAGTLKPKQPFGSFPTKPEVLLNELLLDVYKKYYKYTTVTNEFGDYMLFGVPIDTQTVHLSVDITDIGKYSMSPASMVNAGYPDKLFTGNATGIKSSDDLDDLPNIETQEISVNIVPFWGDAENYIIGITRQDFRIKATISNDFVIFGSTMTAGLYGMTGNPDIDDYSTTNIGLYSISDTKDGTESRVDRFNNNIDIRTYRSVPPIINVFTYTNDIPINESNSNELIIPTNIDYNNQIRKLDKSEYFEYNVNGEFMLVIPCNRNKVITAEDGSEIRISDDSPHGVFTKFFGMILIEYPNFDELPQNSTWTGKYSLNNGSAIQQEKARGKLKIPQNIGLTHTTQNGTDGADTNSWRKSYYTFNGGSVYSVAQFLATKYTGNVGIKLVGHPPVGYVNPNDNIDTSGNTENTFGSATKAERVAGAWFKVSGTNIISETKIDEFNYLGSSNIGGTFIYDLQPNVKSLGAVTSTNVDTRNRYFGGQWLNFCLFFPQYGWVRGYDYLNEGEFRTYNVADIYHNGYRYNTNSIYNEYFLKPNEQTLFGGEINSQFYLNGAAFRTTFIEIPKLELNKLLNVPYKGINIGRWNNNTMDVLEINGDRNSLGLPKLNTTPYKYDGHKTPTTTGRQYSSRAWDEYFSTYSTVLEGDKASAFLFKGMYENDCIKLLSDFSII